MVEIKRVESTRLLNAEDLVDRLKLGRTSVYALLSSGEIPTVRIGKNVRVREMDLERFLAAKSAPEG